MVELWNQTLALFGMYGLWIAIGSLVMFIASIASIPLLVVRIPVDYFTPEGYKRQHQRQHHLLLHLLIIWAKNLCGIILLIAGFIMLFTPGQGLLSILFGLMIMNYPGKYHLECSIIRKPIIFNTINAIREKRDYPPLLNPHS